MRLSHQGVNPAEVLKRALYRFRDQTEPYDPIQLITQFIIAARCGASRYKHLEVTRFDGVI